MDQSPLCHFKVCHISDGETCACLHELVMSFGVQMCFLGNALVFYASAFYYFTLGGNERSHAVVVFCKRSLLGMGQSPP